MKPIVVAILESRTGAHLAELVRRRGWVPMLAPALEEVPDLDARALESLLERWRSNPFDMCIFQTGVGTRALFAAADLVSLTDEFKTRLAAARVVVRGPKPVGELNLRGIRIDLRAASPFTTATVLDALADTPLRGANVLVQRYGAANRALAQGLEARGATVEEIATYRWAIPAHTQPLLDLLGELAEGRIDAVVFTSAVQIEHLHAIAERTGAAAHLAEQMNRVIVASIGPVCSQALRTRGITPTFEADPPKLGPLMTALQEALKPPFVSAQG